ncbi:MAG: hypothetical protein KAF27_03940, partial [Porphyrobacter sp.]|nr:hypothetical protein [Porphyrobacter sp.]
PHLLAPVAPVAFAPDVLTASEPAAASAEPGVAPVEASAALALPAAPVSPMAPARCLAEPGAAHAQADHAVTTPDPALPPDPAEAPNEDAELPVEHAVPQEPAASPAALPAAPPVMLAVALAVPPAGAGLQGPVRAASGYAPGAARPTASTPGAAAARLLPVRAEASTHSDISAGPDQASPPIDPDPAAPRALAQAGPAHRAQPGPQPDPGTGLRPASAEAVPGPGAPAAFSPANTLSGTPAMPGDALAADSLVIGNAISPPPSAPFTERPAEARPPAAAPRPESMIAQVGDIREALRAAHPAMTLPHAEFGTIALRLEPAAPDQWRAVLASRDPGFVPAMQAALETRAIAAAAETSASFSGQNGAHQNGAGEHRYGSTPNGGQGTSQPYMGQSGTRDGEAAPDHRRPSTAAALAARGQGEAEDPAARTGGSGGLFA